MRQNVDKLRRLASAQKSSEAKKMLLADADSHADEMVPLLGVSDPLYLSSSSALHFFPTGTQIQCGHM
jgi:hypothetical protein